MEITVDRKGSYFVMIQADTHIKCHACGHNTCFRDYSTIQVRLAGYTVSATVPSKRCGLCSASRIGANDLNFVEAAAVAELLDRGVRGPEILQSCKTVLGLMRFDLTVMLKKERKELNAILRGEADLSPKQWETVVSNVEGRLRRFTEFRQPIQIRVTKPRHKK